MECPFIEVCKIFLETSNDVTSHSDEITEIFNLKPKKTYSQVKKKRVCHFQLRKSGWMNELISSRTLMLIVFLTYLPTNYFLKKIEGA